MGETIQERTGETLIAKDLTPIGKAQVGGDDKSDVLVESTAKLEQELRAR